MSRQIFISSVQKELQEFRNRVKDYVSSDPLLSQFFTVFQFEKLSELVEKGIFDKHGTTGVGVRYVLTERGHERDTDKTTGDCHDDG